ncbi:SDR family oxidoreductase [Archangium violaceum]|uniref:SDR family oxidoreductase n=1 Tax=Archangium violaceum TaxID=83451 RepID=UPI0036DBF1CB
MILVTGATGAIGRYLVHQLLQEGVPFRALVRDAARGRGLGCEYVVGDFDAPDTLRAALVGVDRLLLNGSVHEAMAGQQKRVVDAAAQAGVAHIVKISAAEASAHSERSINRWHADIEQHLEASGIAWSSLRPTFFMQNLLGYAPAIQQEGRIHGAYGSGRLAMVDCSDIAACAAALLTGSVGSPGVFVVTGPEALTFTQVAERFTTALGKPVTYMDRPVEYFVDALRTRGVPEPIADSFGKMMRAFAADAAAELTPVVRKLTGRPPRTLDTFLAQHLEVFR